MKGDLISRQRHSARAPNPRANTFYFLRQLKKIARNQEVAKSSATYFSKSKSETPCRRAKRTTSPKSECVFSSSCQRDGNLMRISDQVDTKQIDVCLRAQSIPVAPKVKEIFCIPRAVGDVCNSSGKLLRPMWRGSRALEESLARRDNPHISSSASSARMYMGCNVAQSEGAEIAAGTRIERNHAVLAGNPAFGFRDLCSMLLSVFMSVRNTVQDPAYDFLHFVWFLLCAFCFNYIIAFCVVSVLHFLF